MNDIENSLLGNLGLNLLDTEQKLISQEYKIELLRIKAAMYKAYFFRDNVLAVKLEKQAKENADSLTGGFNGFAYASWRENAVFRTLEDMCAENLLTQEEYEKCKIL